MTRTFPTVYGSYVPEPLVDDCFAAIADASDDAMCDVLTFDLDNLDTADADFVSYEDYFSVAS